MNGPNYYSNESSGKLYSMMSGPQALSVLPEMRVEEISRRGYNYIDTIHEDLRREDGMPFLILYRAGSYMHPHQVDDPFFAAHTEGLTINHNGEKDVRNYYPDHEATALGCVEQYQYCISKASFCTSWGYLVDDLHTLGKHLKDDYLQSKEVLYQALIRNQLSVHGYLYSYASRMAKLESSHVTTQYQTSEATISNESWVTEVEIWFMKTILISIFNIQTQVRYSMANDPWYYLDFDTWRNRPVLCDLILFHDAGYTNINFVSFWIATALLVFLCIISYTIKWLHNTSKDIFTRLWGMTPR
ncbi:hypothetical protein BGZ60DRAFT_535758 [Tricladium varicosporioides]|nr:hypothetical protein BGZ60DRAFT_535758 [Hymenoscyphus varicosporioides]